MKAAFYENFGPARDVLRVDEVGLPMPAKGEVRVCLRASGVNPSDVKNRAGRMSSTMPFLRIVPHNDGAGDVEAVGEGVDSDLIGTRVWVWNAQFRRPFGTAATHVTLPAVQVVPLADTVSYIDGACLGVPAMTAHRALTCGSSVKGSVVLVSGGSGGVGRYAVQMAKLLGAAKVIATIGNLERRSSVEAAGADVVLDYRESKVAEAILDAAGGRVDRIVEVEWGTNHALDIQVIKPEGEISVYGSASQMNPVVNIQQLMMGGITMHFRSVFLLPSDARQRAISDLTQWVTAGVLSHEVAEVLPLHEIATAHELVESRSAAGRVMLQIQ